jgi:hypothetical protein
VTIDVDDEVCGLSISRRKALDVVTVWNRLAPTGAGEEQGGAAVEKFKEGLLSGLNGGVKPVLVYYRVCWEYFGG